MKCHLEDILDDGFEIEYTTFERIWYVIKKVPVIGPIGSFLIKKLREAKRQDSSLKNSRVRRRNVGKTVVSKDKEILNLEPGEVVRIRSREEIEGTLDEKNQFRRVEFMESMWRYCGETHKVFKRVEKIFDPRENRLKRCPSTVILKNLFCHGDAGHGLECDRTCLYYWKEAWLERIAR